MWQSSANLGRLRSYMIDLMDMIVHTAPKGPFSEGPVYEPSPSFSQNWLHSADGRSFGRGHHLCGLLACSDRHLGVLGPTAGRFPFGLARDAENAGELESRQLYTVPWPRGGGKKYIFNRLCLVPEAALLMF